MDEKMKNKKIVFSVVLGLLLISFLPTVLGCATVKRSLDTDWFSISIENFKTPIKGLWFVGAQSETYGGVIGTMIGAENAVNLLKYESEGHSTAQTFKSFSV